VHLVNFSVRNKKQIADDVVCFQQLEIEPILLLSRSRALTLGKVMQPWAVSPRSCLLWLT